MESYYSIYNEFQFVDARAYKAKVIDRIIDNEINPGRFVRQNKDNNTYTLLERDHFRKMIRTRLSPSLKKKVSNTQRRVCLHKVTKSYWLSSESSTFQSTTTSTSTVTITSNVLNQLIHRRISHRRRHRYFYHLYSHHYNRVCRS